jgi:hypothetical protein
MNQKNNTLEDVFDEIVKFSDKMFWKGQKMKRKTGFVQNPKMFFPKSCVFLKTFVH